MRRKYDYDPGMPYEPPPYRRRKQRYGAEDDAWAAASEDAYYDEDFAPGELAAGYVDHELDERWARADDDDGWTPPPYRGRSRRRSWRDQPRAPRPRYDHRPLYPDSPTYHRDRARRGEYGMHYDKPKRGAPVSTYSPLRERVAGIPFWQILVVVILGIVALLATMLACVSILLL